MIDELFEKLNKAREIYTDDVGQDLFDRWEEGIKEASNTLSVTQLEAFREKLIEMANKVKSHRERLATDTELAEKERMMLFAEIKVYNELLNYFLQAKHYITYINEELNKF